MPTVAASMVTTAIEYSANPQTHLRFSPALYVAPEPSRLSSALTSSSSSTSPSPYVANQKRREWPQPQPHHHHHHHRGVERDTYDHVLDGGGHDRGDGFQKKEEEAPAVRVDEFFDPTETASVASSVGHATASDFYDVGEDFLSDGSTTPLSKNVECEMATLRVSLLEEVERRKSAEESLVHIQTQWTRAASHFSKVGLSFPPIPTGQRTQELDDSIAQVCQEVVVSRFVSNAFGRGLAQAEAEASAEEVIQSKNREISRLHDRLQYYEAVNREMCHRNQEAVELARQRRRRRQQAKRWMWGLVGFSVTIGASLLAYSSLPHLNEALPSPQDQSSVLSLEPVESSCDLIV